MLRLIMAQQPMAAPPDDGHSGTLTTPDSTLLAERSDTRASETLGKTEPRERHVNRGLWLFWIVIAALLVILVLLAYLPR
jgi:predicted nucleic acid-binding Zn ribbon protein